MRTTLIVFGLQASISYVASFMSKNQWVSKHLLRRVPLKPSTMEKMAATLGPAFALPRWIQFLRSRWGA